MTNSHNLAPSNILQEYLSLIHEATMSADVRVRDARLLRAWGVYQYFHHGAASCDFCQEPVRLALPITSERMNGDIVHFHCLCTRCTFLELEISNRIIMQVGQARVEYPQQ